jgi:hypothetical protein
MRALNTKPGTMINLSKIHFPAVQRTVWITHNPLSQPQQRHTCIIQTNKHNRSLSHLFQYFLQKLAEDNTGIKPLTYLLH